MISNFDLMFSEMYLTQEKKRFPLKSLLNTFRNVWTSRLLSGHGRLHLGPHRLQGGTGVFLDYRFVLELMPMMWDLTGNKAKQVSDQTLLNVLMLIMLTCLVWLLTGCEAKQVPHYTYCLPSLAALLFLRNDDAT